MFGLVLWFFGDVDLRNNVPLMMVRFGFGGREDGLRVRTVTVWLRERALSRARRPLRPVAPEMKMCMLCEYGMDEMFVLLLI